jgi:hypothetical protein
LVASDDRKYITRLYRSQCVKSLAKG